MKKSKIFLMIALLAAMFFLGCTAIIFGLKARQEKNKPQDTYESGSISADVELASREKQKDGHVYEPIVTDAPESTVIEDEGEVTPETEDEDSTDTEESTEAEEDTDDSDAEDADDTEDTEEDSTDAEDNADDDADNDDTENDTETSDNNDSEENVTAPEGTPEDNEDDTEKGEDDTEKGEDNASGAPVSTAKIEVIVSGINVRSEKSSTSDILGMVYYSQVYDWIAEESSQEFFAINFNGQTGYVKSIYVDVIDATTEKEKELENLSAQLKQLYDLEEKKQQEQEAMLTQIAQLKTSTPTPIPTNTPVPTQATVVYQNTTVAASTPIPTQAPTQAPVATATPTPAPTQAASSNYTRTGPVTITNDGPYSDELLLFSVVATEPSPYYPEQLAAASVVVNLMKYQHRTMNEVLSAPGQFTGYASGYLFRTIETYLSGNYPARYDQCMQAARDVLQNGPTIPYLMFIVPWDGIEQWAPNGERIGMSYFYTKVFV